MHYYQFNIGDYAKSTKYLDPMEDLIYRRLLDICYDTEKPLPNSIDKITKLVGLKNNTIETQAILNEYFKLTKNGYIQKRVNKELSKYRAKADSARVNGKKGGRPKKTQSVNLANPPLTQSKAKQEPITNNHKPITNIKEKIKRFTPPSIEEVKIYCNERLNFVSPQDFVDHYESNGWMRGKTKIKDWKACVRTWEKNAAPKKGSSRTINNLSECEAFINE